MIDHILNEHLWLFIFAALIGSLVTMGVIGVLLWRDSRRRYVPGKHRQ